MEREKKILNAGFLFFEMVRGISSFVKSVTKQPFTGMAFYYQTTFFNNEPKEIVILFDFFGLKIQQFKDKVGNTIEQFRKLPGLLRLVKRPLNAVYENGVYNLKKSQLREDLFREKISTIRFGNVDEEDLLKDIFGLKTISGKKSPIQKVNEIILFILENEFKGSSQQYLETQYQSYNENFREMVEDSDLGRLHVLGLLGTSFYPVPDSFGLSQLLQERNLLGDLIDIPLENSNSLKQQNYLQANSEVEKIFMEKFLISFNRLLFENRKFLSIVIQGINFGKELEENKTEISEQMIDDLILEANNLTSYLHEEILKGEIFLPDLILNLNSLLQKIQFLGHFKNLSRTVKMFTTDVSRTILLHPTSSPLVTQEKLSSLVSQIINASQTIQKKGIPEIDLGELSRTLQAFTGRRISTPNGRFAGYLNNKDFSSQIYEIILTPTTTLEELKQIPKGSRDEILQQLVASPNNHLMNSVIESLKNLSNEEF